MGTALTHIPSGVRQESTSSPASASADANCSLVSGLDRNVWVQTASGKTRPPRPVPPR